MTAPEGPGVDDSRQAWVIPVVGSAVITVLVLAAAVLLLAGNSDSGPDEGAAKLAEVTAGTPPPATGRTTTIHLLVGGQDKSKIDPRTFDIIAAGIPWVELASSIFPGDEIEVVMVYQEDQGRSVGIATNPVDPARVDAIWRDMGLPGRRRPLWVTPTGDVRDKKLEAWLRQKLTALGFELTNDRPRAREHVIFTITRTR